MILGYKDYHRVKKIEEKNYNWLLYEYVIL